MRWKPLLVSIFRLPPSSVSRPPSSFTSLSMSTVSTSVKENVLLKEWATPYGIPPYKNIQPSDFEPALEIALADHIEEVTEFARKNDVTVTFENIIFKLDAAGGLLSRIRKVFYNLCASCSSEELQQVQLKMSPILAAHSNKIYTMPGLFEKIDKSSFSKVVVWIYFPFLVSLFNKLSHL